MRLSRRGRWEAALGAVTLALGVGAGTAVFSVVNPVLLKPLPFYPQADRIATVWYGGADGSRALQAYGNFREVALRARGFDALAALRPWQPALTGQAGAERLDGQRVTAGYFRVLGVPPAMGRDFDAADDRFNGPKVVVLSERLWQRRFGGAPGIVGRPVTIDGASFTVIGVMPRSFEDVLAPTADAWTLLQFDNSLPAGGREWGHQLRVLGRVRSRVALDDVRHELDRIAKTPVAEISRPPYASMARGLIVSSLQEDLAGPVRPVLIAMTGAVFLLLAIASVNVTNLLLARTNRRRGEFAVRMALGAGRANLVRQVLVESVALATVAGVLGLAVAEAGIRLLLSLRPPELPQVGAIGIDFRAFLFAVTTSGVVGVATGLVPALRASRIDPQAALQRESRLVASGHHVTRRVLVITEVALALVLLVGAGLLWRSVQRLLTNAPGFDPSHVLTMQVQVSPGPGFSDREAVQGFFDRALDAVRLVPGISSAAFTSQLPLSGDNEAYGVFRENQPNAQQASADAFRYAVTPEYFEAMAIPRRDGRLFDAHDAFGSAVRPVLVNESLARRLFPGGDALGQRIRLGGAANRPFDEIVGVVGDVKQAALSVSQSDAVYVMAAQWVFPDNARWLVVRAAGDAEAPAQSVKRAVWSVDPNEPISRVGTMSELVAKSEARRRFAMVVFEVFALVALVLAAIGLYGVLAGSVAERIREIGLRSALGASRLGLLAMVMRSALTLVGVGLAIGLVVAAVSSRALTTLLFGVSRLDAVTYVGMVAVLTGVSVVAAWFPAWRAATVDPLVTLRGDN